jgi:cell division protein FtsB
VAATTWVLVFGETGWMRVRAEERAVDALRRESAEIQHQTETLEARVEEIQRPASPLLEKVARERYLMKREGEEVIHILDPSAATTTSETVN